jgi:hypothetical protein
MFYRSTHYPVISYTEKMSNPEDMAVEMDIPEETVPDEGTVAIMPETNSRVWLKQEDEMLLSLV